MGFCLSLFFNVAFQSKRTKSENVPVSNKNKQGNKQNSLVLQTPHYEQKYINKLNKDIPLAKEPETKSLVYDYQVDESDQQNPDYQKLGDYPYTFGEGFKQDASYSENLGTYSYQTKTESSWQEDHWSSEFNHETSHRITCFDQSGTNVWSDINLYKNGSYQKYLDVDWNVSMHMDQTWKYDYNF